MGREARRRHEIISAMIDAVGELGIDGATMREVARRAMVSTGMLTHYYLNKQELIKDTLRESVRRFTERVERSPRPAGALAHLRRIFEVAYVADPDVPPPSLWLAYWAQSTRSSEVRDIMARRVARDREAMARLVETAISEGALPDDVEPGLAADFLMALMAGLIAMTALQDPSFAPDRASQVSRLAFSRLSVPEDSSQRPCCTHLMQSGTGQS